MNYNDKIDLHIHTTFSNGKDDLLSVLKQAEANGVKLISITDYNTLISYFNIKNNLDITDYYTGEIMVGLEIRCRFFENNKLRCSDMLIYNIDLDKIEIFQHWLEENTDKDKTLRGQFMQLEHFKKCAKKLGIKYDEDLSLADKNSKAGMVMINNILKYYDENKLLFPNLERYQKTPSSAWIEVFTNPNSEFFFDISKFCPTLEEVIKLAHSCNALVFAAHPFAYITDAKDEKEATEGLLAYVRNCLSLGVDGVECFNQYNCELVPYALEATTELFKYCLNNNIKISGGTDYHSLNDIRQSGIGNLGSNRVRNAISYVPYNLVANWAKPIKEEFVKEKSTNALHK